MIIIKNENLKFKCGFIEYRLNSSLWKVRISLNFTQKSAYFEEIFTLLIGFRNLNFQFDVVFLTSLEDV